MSDSATGILKENGILYCTLIRKYLMDSEIKRRKFFGVSRDIRV
jgi:hypothetical protein